MSEYAAGPRPAAYPRRRRGLPRADAARLLGAPLEADATFVREIEPLAEAAQKMAQLHVVVRCATRRRWPAPRKREGGRCAVAPRKLSGTCSGLEDGTSGRRRNRTRQTPCPPPTVQSQRSAGRARRCHQGAPQLWTLSRRFCCGPKTGSAGRNCRGERAGHRLAAEELHMVLLVRGPADEFVEVFRVESTVALAHDP